VIRRRRSLRGAEPVDIETRAIVVSREEFRVARAVRIYTTPWCPYCNRAKAILTKNGVTFTDIDVDGDREKRAWLLKATGRSTVPQIFFDDEPIGGCDDLSDIVARGELQGRLAG
jgi:glutaredoxin 3